MIARLFRCFNESVAGSAALPPPAEPSPYAPSQPQSAAPFSQVSAPAGERIAPLAPQDRPAAPRVIKAGSKRLSRALREFARSEQSTRWCTLTTREDNLYIWDVDFYFSSGTMQQSLHKYGVDCVKIEVRFPPDYPRAAPAVRVVSPQIAGLANRQAGVFGGALCLNMLHQWELATNEEAMLATLHAAIATAKVTKTKAYSRDDYDAGHAYIQRMHPDWRVG